MNGKSRGWLITGAILSILVGLLALSSPLFFSLLIVRFLGAFALASGLISLFSRNLWQKRRSSRAQRSFCAGSNRRGPGFAVLYPFRIESYYARVRRIFDGRRHYLHLRCVQDSGAQ